MGTHSRPFSMIGRTYVVKVFLVILTVEATSAREVAQDPLMHYATDTEVVIRKDDGSYKMAYDTADGIRAEVRDAGGVVKGVYGFTGPNGKIITKSYLSDGQGYRLASLSEMGVELPALPYNLHPKAGQRKFPKQETLVETLEPASSRQEIKEPTPITYQHPVQINPFGRLDHGLAAVVIEPAVKGLGRFIKQENDNTKEDYSDVVIVGEDYNDGVVGAGGIAVSTPTGNAVVGPGGIAISAPVATSQAGVGGIAIAGGQAIAIAGVQNPGQQFFGGSGSGPGALQDLEDANQPGWEAYRSAGQKEWFFRPKNNPAPTLPIEIKASKGSQITSYPIVANYFFNVPQHFFAQAKAASTKAATYARVDNPPTPDHSQVVYVPWYENQKQTNFISST